jgi:hypothetical protein
MRTEQVNPGDESDQPAQAPTEDSLVVDNQADDLQTSVGIKVDDTLSGKGRIDLGIDWDSLDKESLFARMKTFDDAENLYPRIAAGRHDGYLIHEGELNTHSGKKLKIRFQKVISPNFHELQIDIVKPDISEDNARHYVANFDFLQLKNDHAEEWDMKHRKTQPVYRRQGIAEKVLDITEEVLKNRVKNTGLSQTISAKSWQKDLTVWLEKRKFVVATPEDEARLQRLKANDPDLHDVTVDGETHTFDDKEFKIKFPDLSGPEDPAVWDFDNYEKPFFYMKSSFKIKMKKSM